jgi:hypothetical protein
MEGETEVTVVVEKPSDATTETVVETTAETVIDTAIVIADKIDEARQEGEQVNKEIKYSLDDLYSAVMQQTAVILELKGLIEYLTDEVATLTALEVAEVVVEKDPAEVEEIVEVAAVVENTPPEVPEEPQVRATKKRKYL